MNDQTISSLCFWRPFFLASCGLPKPNHYCGDRVSELKLSVTLQYLQPSLGLAGTDTCHPGWIFQSQRVLLEILSDTMDEVKIMLTRDLP